MERWRLSRRRSKGVPMRADRRLVPLVMAWLALVGCVAVQVRAAEPAVSETDAAKPTAAGLEFFEKSVRPLLVKRCYECHAADEVNGGLSLDTREGVLKGGDSGAAIRPGDPNSSRLIEAVRYKNPDLQMPPKNQLSAAEVQVLEK